MQDLLASLPEKMIVKCTEQNNETGKEAELPLMHIFTVAQAISQHPQHSDDSPLRVMENLLVGGIYIVRCELVTRWYSVKGSNDHG
jgi:hypothetical protein